MSSLTLAANRSQMPRPRTVVQIPFHRLFVTDSCAQKAAIQEVGQLRRHEPITVRGGNVLLPSNRSRGSIIAQLDSGGLTQQPWALKSGLDSPCTC